MMWVGLTQSHTPFKGRAASPSAAVEGVDKIKTWERLSAVLWKCGVGDPPMRTLLNTQKDLQTHCQKMGLQPKT